MSKRAIYPLFLFIFISVFAHATNLDVGSTSVPLTPLEIRQSIIDNPSIAASREEILKDRALALGNNTLTGPEVGFEHLWARGGIPTRWTLSLDQSFDWPATYSARKKLIHSQTVTSLQNLRIAQFSLAENATQLLIRLAYTQRRLKVYDALLTDYTELSLRLDEALDRGTVTILDKKKTDVQTAILYAEREKILGQQADLILQLQLLAGTTLPVDRVDWLAMPLPSSLKPLDYYLSCVSSDPTISMRRSSLETAKLEKDLSRLSSLPSFTLGYRHSFEEQTHFDGFALSVSLPRWGITSAARAADLSVTTATTMLDIEEKIAVARIENLHHAASSLKQSLTRLQTKALDASYLRLLKQALEERQITLLDFILEQTYYRDTTLSVLELEEQYSLLLAMLDRPALAASISLIPF